MTKITDTYRTLTQNISEIIFKDKSSKFIGYAFPVNSEEEIKNHLENIKKEHFSARHWCYAWQLGKEKKRYRANDDGEPSGTAGLPIYGQIQSYDLTNILIIVVRYFGGIKLGVSGLINAYKTTAQMTLEEAKIEERTIDVSFEIRFEYKNMNKVMKIIKEKNANIVNQKLEMDCRVYINVRKNDADQLEAIFSQLYEVEIKRLEE